MSRLEANGDAPHTLFTPIRFQGFDVSWAGPNPFGPGFAFGSENGRVLMTDEAGVPLQKQIRDSITNEAINGIDGTGTSLAVSTREEVTLVTWAAADPDRKSVSGIPQGAHGIVVAPSGDYVAPLGRKGILVLPPTSTEPDDPIGVIAPHKEGLNFYRVVTVLGTEGKNVLVCATRQGGMGIMEFNRGQSTISTKVVTFAALDLVDVCVVGGTPGAPAVAGIGRDGTLLLVRDALRDENPATIKFDSVHGAIYRLLCARGHLFLLTNRGLYGLMNLGDRLVKGLMGESFTTSILVLPMEAVDANMVGDRWLLVTMPDEVRRIDVDLIDRADTESRHNGEIQETHAETLTPEWQIHRVQYGSQQLAGAA